MVKQKQKQSVIPYFLLIAACVAVDQAVKALVREGIPLYGSVDFIPGVMDLTYVRNTGMAFSLFANHTWVLTLLSSVISLVLVAALVKGFFRHPLGRSLLALVIAGALGNLIDRAVFGYVTDMFRTLFIDFAVFNVADICITAGGALLALYLLFFYERLEGKSLADKAAPEGEAQDDGAQDG